MGDRATDHALLMAVQRCAKAAVGAMVARYAAATCNELPHSLSEHGQINAINIVAADVRI